VGPTAGFRNAGWTMGGIPGDVKVSVHPLQTSDGAAVNGFLYAGARTDTVLCIMHPREFLATHYLVPEILQSGCAVFTQTSRSVGNDLRLEHEIALLDVAAGVNFLRDAGFKRVILVGNSGGASLYGFYNEQSLLPPERRLEKTPGGRPTGLAKARMSPVDAVVLLAPHQGQGIILQNCIDPSVRDEADPLSVDASLDFLDERNGYRPGPAGSLYDAAFVTRFRAAQRARVERLDILARSMISDRLAARKRSKDSGSRADILRGAFSPAITVWRTDADLRCWDLSLDPSDRVAGSVWSKDPIASNYGVVGFGRFCTPESWLSTWSGLSSQANLLRTAKSIEQPCLVISYTGDSILFPADAQAVFDAVGSTSKRYLRIRGNHHGQALAEGERPGRDLAGEEIRGWLKEIGA
jgi:pimeloyl-ACP methyl ester carboxylesterase